MKSASKRIGKNFPTNGSSLKFLTRRHVTQTANYFDISEIDLFRKAFENYYDELRPGTVQADYKRYFNGGTERNANIPPYVRHFIRTHKLEA